MNCESVKQRNQVTRPSRSWPRQADRQKGKHTHTHTHTHTTDPGPRLAWLGLLFYPSPSRFMLTRPLLWPRPCMKKRWVYLLSQKLTPVIDERSMCLVSYGICILMLGWVGLLALSICYTIWRQLAAKSLMKITALELHLQENVSCRPHCSAKFSPSSMKDKIAQGGRQEGHKSQAGHSPYLI